MLDPASIERLAEFPEQNDPLLNVALAEEEDSSLVLRNSVFQASKICGNCVEAAFNQPGQRIS